MKQKLENERNDVRDDISETRAVVETMGTSLVAEQVKIKALRLGVLCLVKRLW